MDEMKLVISGPSGTKEILLDPKGMTLGREANCDIVLDDDAVSRAHAQISQDPFGRWIVEDLGSQNGTLIEGQRIEARAVLANQTIEIRPFALLLSPQADEPTAAGSAVRATLPVLDESVVSYGPDKAAALSPALVQHLNELASGLLKLSKPSELYSQVCECLTETLDTLVAVVRVPSGSIPLPKFPDILACRFGPGVVSDPALRSSHVHLSKRVLDAVRSTDAPVMATSGSSSGQSMHLTIVDEHKPHVVFAVRVNDLGDSVDALYIDILESQAPDEMLDFVEVVARQINFAQKNLFLAELTEKEKALRQANNQLREKDRIKDEYVSRITHDIKGHLAAIHSCLYVAGDEVSDIQNETLEDYLGRALRRTMQLSEFVKELLTLTRMRLSGQMQAEPFSLPECISKAVAQVASRAQEKSITVTCSVEPAVGQSIGSELSVTEMLTNLISNAVKYTPDNKTVDVRAKALGDAVQIEIADTGIGIPQGELDNVFDEFFRATNAKQGQEEGTGLGLSIVKQIVESHGGTITVQSSQGQGTTFMVTLPVDGGARVCS